MTGQRSDLARITLSVLFIGGLIVGSLWILSPFRRFADPHSSAGWD